MAISHVGVGLVGPFPTARSQMKFILVAVDYFTKWIEAEPLATIASSKIINFYWQRIVCRFGVPQTIVSDNIIQFTSKRTRELCQEMRIQMRFSSVEHPQTNGKVESCNKVILRHQFGGRSSSPTRPVGVIFLYIPMELKSILGARKWTWS